MLRIVSRACNDWIGASLGSAVIIPATELLFARFEALY
jgi:hypothetical protein